MQIKRYGLLAKPKVSYKLSLVLVVLSMVPVFFTSRTVFKGFAQTKDRSEKVIKKLNSDNDPVEILSVGNSKNLVKLGEKFTQESDWLKDFTVELKNKSDKAITYLSVELDFPETKSTGNIMSFPMNYGVSPLNPNKNENIKPIKLGESVKLTLTEKKFEHLKTFIERRHLLDNLNKIDIRIVFVLFEDGTGWSSGHLVQPDPNNPKNFIPIQQIGGN